MNRSLWLRFLGLSVVFALLLGLLYARLIREVAGDAREDVQRSVYLFIARIVEEAPYADAIRHLDRLRTESPSMSPEVWVISAAGQVMASNSVAPPPQDLLQEGLPQQVHDIVMRGHFFSGASAAAVIRLNAAEPAWLVVRNAAQAGRHLVLTLGTFLVATVLGAIFLGLSMVLLYLRGHSHEARRVIARIESGDLAARFKVDRLDAVGRLMHDFNRMADEIGRLVARLQATERARRELLQELGHDLRTPLTSLRTAIEALAAHGEAMSSEERQEFFGVVNSEFGYFRKLVDDLFFIAEIDEPRYRNAAQRLDIVAIVKTEIQSLEASARAAHEAGGGIRIEAELDAAMPDTCAVIGDAYLVGRLFRNLFDNAARHASSVVRIRTSIRPGFVDVSVADDGAGMSAAAIAAFGQRRRQRVLSEGGDLSASLGLGSVIIKTIVSLHGGDIALESGPAGGVLQGTRITVSLPLEEVRDAALV
ncbi:MAG TPA: HAMP domain-containing sensor histidine kinase [Noviherbaspirillum sp.]|uniref:HAMP domain-containing sensor histidine kinase n=1 Tax=Noviherbaspirillum sp. TaxID=1926288 RepID=UPI002B4A62A6|nr:HAMP domain-containing sensor histidine kinase [Noviherbaspirillum sp.]HJV86333.1 HAMP domain-containing sensor histidine kinase [Noviherbaspirillum sp.]